MTETEETEWQERLAAMREEMLAKKAAKRAERAELKRRRDYGLKQRYATKTARNQLEKKP